MSKFIRNLLLGGLVAFTVYLVGLFVVGSFFPLAMRGNLPYNLKSNGYTFARMAEADTVKDVDVLILGSSHAYRGYDTRIFEQRGLRTFNLGSSAQTPIQTKYLLEKYIDKLKPELVIVDVYSELFKSDGVESTIDLLINMPIDGDLAEMSFERENMRTTNVLFYSYMRQALGLDDEMRDLKKKSPTGNYVRGGYVESLHQYKGLDESFEEQEITFSPEQLEAFSAIINELKERDIDYVLFQAPLPQARYRSISNPGATDSIMRTYGAYFDANARLKIPDSCFYDASHLNQKGVQTYNSFVWSVLDSLSAEGKLDEIMKANTLARK